MAPLPQRAPLVLTGFSPPPYQDPIFSTIIPVGYICEVASPGPPGSGDGEENLSPERLASPNTTAST